MSMETAAPSNVVELAGRTCAARAVNRRLLFLGQPDPRADVVDAHGGLRGRSRAARARETVRRSALASLVEGAHRVLDEAEQLEWNAAWQYALDVLPEAAHTSSC